MELDVEQFRSDGFTHLKRFFDKETLDKIRKKIDMGDLSLFPLQVY